MKKKYVIVVENIFGQRWYEGPSGDTYDELQGECVWASRYEAMEKRAELLNEWRDTLKAVTVFEL